MLFREGFTLIELLVVVAITAILAGIALPTYNTNSTRAKVSELVPVLDGLIHEVMISYNTKGKVPNTLENITGDGANGGYDAYAVPNLTTHLHYDDGSTWTNVGAMVQLSIPEAIGKAIPGYAVSTDGINGSYNSVVMAFYDDDGIIKIYCGRWDTSTKYIPIQYLPSGCNTDNLKPVVTGN